MALPKLTHPTFKMFMPSARKEVTSRPFLVAEEKILLMAQSSGSDRDIVLAIKQILNNVVQDSWFDTKNLTSFDLEYMFLKLRAASVSNILELSYIDNEDGKKYDFKVDISEIELTVPPGEVVSKLDLKDGVGITLKWPSVEVLEQLGDELLDEEIADAVIRACIHSIYDSETVYLASEQAQEDLDAFIDSMETKTFEDIRKFLAMSPSVRHTIEYKNSLGNDRKIELRTLRDFFTWG